MTAAEQWSVDVKAGVVGCGTDQANMTGLDIGQEQILLRLVEAMQLVNKEDGWSLGFITCHMQAVPQFRNIRENRIDPDEATAGGSGDDLS